MIDKEKLVQLENLLLFYGKTRQLDFKLADFIDEDNRRVLETNQQLLRDAALSTREIDSIDDRIAHDRAKDALLYWCMIYCQNVLMAHYGHRGGNTQEDIKYGSELGVMKCFDSIRDAVNKYFQLPEDERKAKFKAKGNCSVKTYMTICAGNALLSEFRKYYKYLVEIKRETAEQLKKDGEVVFENDGRFYVFPKTVPVMVTGEDGEIFENPALIEALSSQFLSTCTQKMLDDYDLKVFVRKVLVSMIQNGSLSKDDLELLSRIFGFRGEPEKISDIERDWIKRGIIREGEIYNRKNRIFKRLEDAFSRHPKWPDFAESLKAGRPVFF